MRKDVIVDRYGRLYELPSQLAAIGSEVSAFCLNYHGKKNFLPENSLCMGGVTWYSHDLRIFPVTGLLNYEKKVLRVLEQFSPDVIVGSSDCYHIVLASRLARQLGIPFVADLYDNYASFGMAKIPFVQYLYYRELRRASSITCVSEPLAKFIAQRIGSSGQDNRIEVIESTIPEGAFKVYPKSEARNTLGLSPDDRFVGYAGALDLSRGIEALYQAFFLLKQRDPGVKLILAGQSDGSCPIPQDPDILYLGQLSHEEVPEFYSALDVGVICLKDSSFGRYSFPQKAYEMLAMKMPLAVASVGAMASLFSNYPDILYKADDADSLCRVLCRQLSSPTVVELPIPSWRDQAVKMNSILHSVVDQERGLGH